jgi:hypothetical protein
MGCDIHLTLEEKHGDYWEPLLLSGAAWSQRNYRLFSWLANARQRGSPGDAEYIMPIAMPRGLPADCSKTVKEHLSHSADHSLTWLLASEIIARPGETVPDFAHAFVVWLTGLLHDPYTWLGMNDGTEPERVRLVFGFDN